MPRVKKNSTATNIIAANPGFETQHWAAPDARHGRMDATEYKHVVLGLINARRNPVL